MARHRNRFVRWTVVVRAAIQSREAASPIQVPRWGPEECDFRGPGSHLAPAERLGQEGCRTSLPKKTQVPATLVAPIPGRESVRYVSLRCSLCKAAFLLLSALWVLGVQNRNLRRRVWPWGFWGPGMGRTPPDKPTDIVGFSHSFPIPLQLCAAHPLAHTQASLAKSTLRAPRPTLNTRSIQSIILSETLSLAKHHQTHLYNQHLCSFFAETTLHESLLQLTLVSNFEFTKQNYGLDQNQVSRTRSRLSLLLTPR
ncbi:uncharacterized protein B0H64DRAFT_61873 [Chaetomium fimeti]|uniref:Uncharacterized protein n=1 Tax=Chaetomium fimeti TaxID=1854472 RepID=A0AAE0H5J4_9PEZI|nr:hypothetical protein B0H64DRAFT_61873 [Chaetomium fimeti]